MDIMLTNLEIVPGRKINEHLGLVQGSSVRAKHFGRDLMAGFKNIFGGEITNWEDVGGLNENIMVIIRPPNSGTHLYFKDHILGGNSYTENSTVLPNTTIIVNTISENSNAIGYGGIGYGSSLRHCSIDGIKPSEKNIRNDLYPITRYLNLYTIKKPTGEVKKFIDWIISTQGQRIEKKLDTFHYGRINKFTDLIFFSISQLKPAHIPDPSMERIS